MPATPSDDHSGEDSRLTPLRMSGYAVGDFTVNTVLVALSMIYTLKFLPEHGDMRPALAGLIPLIGRVVDALTDPFMGRISDLTRWKAGRRRPYFLIGAIPLGVSFAMMWAQPGLEAQSARFAYYTFTYVLMSLALTVVSVPYLALLPEMAVGYDARTSLHTYRNIGSVIGIFAAVALIDVAKAFGDGAQGFAMAGLLYGGIVSIPWILVYYSSWENPSFQSTQPTLGFRDGLRALSNNRAFVRVTGMYLFGRMAMDLVGAMLIVFLERWIRRPEDFTNVMFLFFATVIAALPFWLKQSQKSDKAPVFVIGCVWWAFTVSLFLGLQPEWPPWILYVCVPISAIGFAVVDLIPWSMLGEVIDQDELESGERREGLYNGVFMFVRKLAGAGVVSLAGLVLDLSGYDPHLPTQSETTLWSIRLMTSVGPAALILASILFARNYPITRTVHQTTLAALTRRRQEDAS